MTSMETKQRDLVLEPLLHWRKKFQYLLDFFNQNYKVVDVENTANANL